MNPRRIGIMGGTFDPIHYGHLVTAEVARHRFDLELVIFIPAANPPHKQNSKVSDSDRRMTMTLLATVTNPLFSVSDIEYRRTGYSYTYDTICELQEIYGKDVELFFITGADAIAEISHWHKFDLVLNACTFIAATRPGYDLDHFWENSRILRESITKIIQLEVPALAISSTDIRERVTCGKPIKYLVPETVEFYIQKEGLYRNDE